MAVQQLGAPGECPGGGSSQGVLRAGQRGARDHLHWPESKTTPRARCSHNSSVPGAGNRAGAGPCLELTPLERPARAPPTAAQGKRRQGGLDTRLGPDPAQPPPYLYWRRASAPAGRAGKPGRCRHRCASSPARSKRCCGRTTVVPGSSAMAQGATTTVGDVRRQRPIKCSGAPPPCGAACSDVTGCVALLQAGSWGAWPGRCERRL